MWRARHRTTAWRLAGLGLAMLAATGQVQAFDLMAAYRLAQDSDPEYRAALAARDAALEARPQARSLLLPNLSAEAGLSRSRQEILSSSSPFFTSETYYYTTRSYSLSLVQPLYHRDYFVQLRQADSQVARAEAERRAAEQALIARVAERYFDVLAARDTLVFARAEKQAVARQLEQARKRFKVGLLAITDVHEAQARYDQTLAAEIDATNALDISREALREIVGQAPDELEDLQEQIDLVMPEPEDIGQWIEQAQEQNLSLLAARFAADIAREEIERLRSGHLPTLDVVANHSYTDIGGGSFGGRETQDSALSLQLSLPLYQGGRVVSQTRQARHEFEQAQEGVERQSRATERQVRATYLSVMAGISRVKALQQAVVSAQSALESTRAGFEVGTRTIVDVLAGESNLYRARRDYARARYDYILDTLRLKQAAGMLGVEDLQRVNDWLS